MQALILIPIYVCNMLVQKSLRKVKCAVFLGFRCIKCLMIFVVHFFSLQQKQNYSTQINFKYWVSVRWIRDNKEHIVGQTVLIIANLSLTMLLCGNKHKHCFTSP